VIERAVYVTFEVFREPIESLHGVAESTIVVATITAIIRVSTVLGRCCGGQCKRQDCRSEN
jgi:hypothetical protein